ncbi:MFS transporter [Hydrogenophaga luteola]|uniref:MFS transporter n=1 Tax=Hydrogenophaga luteola TaxID=1591122 RepID=A0ABV7W2N7_9BURK
MNPRAPPLRGSLPPEGADPAWGGPAPDRPAADSPATRLATRLAFLVAGFGLACWAPLVPFAKQRLGVGDGVLGALLLCLGVGSVVAMLWAGWFSARHGSRPVVIAGGLGVALLLPLLALADAPLTLGLALMLFGAALGSLDVAMNVHALAVERDAGRPLMSGFHALFSVGGLLGAAAMTALLSAGWSPLAGTLLGSGLMLAAMALVAPRLLRATPAAEAPTLAWPRGPVLLLALLAGVCFLVEGAVLDWSALLLTEGGLLAAAQGGLGFMVFSVAMTAGRFGGDALCARLGDRVVLTAGGLLAVGGFVLVLLAASAGPAMAGFFCIGLGASNLVPVLFRRAGAQTVMAPGLAIAAISTTGYAGVLLGPAAIGFVSQLVGLPIAFALLAALLALLPLLAHRVVARPA